MNTLGYIITAAVVFACIAYILVVPVWGRRKKLETKWGRGTLPPSPVPELFRQGEERARSPRPQSAARMRSARHETRKPRSPVRAVPDALSKAVPTEAPGDISTLLTIAAFDSAHFGLREPSDSSGGSDSSCDSGGDGGGGGGGD